MREPLDEYTQRSEENAYAGNEISRTQSEHKGTRGVVRTKTLRTNNANIQSKLIHTQMKTTQIFAK